MAKTKTTAHVDQRQCQKCEQWLHHSRFRSRLATHGSMCSRWFNPLCKACEAIERNQKKNEDRPFAIIERRARSMANKCGTSFDFFWMNLNWKSLIPMYRALVSDPDACCQSCGHGFENERDIQIEHILPPRRVADWARHHARNLRFLCTNCNNAKGGKDPSSWLDDEDGARIANEKQSSSVKREPEPDPPKPGLFDLFDFPLQWAGKKS